MRYLVLMALFLAACASLEKKADEAYTKGEFFAAASLYQQVVPSNPNNAVAIERLRTSRQQVIEKRLIEVRLLRMSENHQDALDKLKNVMADEAKWNVAPPGAAYSAQTEEIEELFRWFNAQVKREIADR